MAISIVDIRHVSPSKGAPPRLLLPLLHSDIICLPSPLTETLFFYHARFSESFFHNCIIPSLEISLSLALKHFSLLAGNLLIPLSSGIPVCLYSAGDSVALTIAQSGADFQHLTRDHSFIDAAELDDFVPRLPPPTYFSRQIVKQPAAAIQITLFPNYGVGIGLNIHHAKADRSTVDGFVREWASINKFISLGDGFLSYNSRSIGYDAGELAAKYWNQMKMARPASPPATDVEARFVLTETIEKILMKFLLNQEKPAGAARDSSTFVVAAAYVWCCLAMSAAAAGETVADDEPEFLAMAFDSHNCLTPVLIKSTHGRLKRKGCFVAAAEAIAEAIRKVNNSGRGSLDGSRNLSTDLSNLSGNRKLVVGGSPTFDAYGVDYGWGRPQMFTSLSNNQVHICRSRDGGVEIVMWKPRPKMAAFAAIFDRGLTEVEDLHIMSTL